MSDALLSCERFRGAVEAALTRFEADLAAGTAGRPAPRTKGADALLLNELRRDEGVVRQAYQDSLGYWTIGVGRLIDARKGGGLSDEEVDYLLLNDVETVRAQLDASLPWWRSLDPVRQRVLINMAFNLGIKGLMGFKNTLAAIKAGQWAKAAAGMKASKWASQVKGRADRLAHMMTTGETP